jgi:hypothetical protein
MKHGEELVYLPPALTLTLSPRRGNSRCQLIEILMGVEQQTAILFLKGWKQFLLSAPSEGGERVGVRAS